MAVNLMEKGEKCRLHADAKYCQPIDGRPTKIPEKGELVIELELFGKMCSLYVCYNQLFYVCLPTTIHRKN